MTNTVKALEATETRIAVWNACRQAGDDCKGCPYQDVCEAQFPYMDRSADKDNLPCDYKLSDDGKYFQV